MRRGNVIEQYIPSVANLVTTSEVKINVSELGAVDLHRFHWTMGRRIMDEATKLVELPSVYSTIPSSCPWCGVAIYRIFDELGDWMIYEKGQHLKHHACEPFNQWVEANKDILGFTSMSLCGTRFQLWLAGKKLADLYAEGYRAVPPKGEK